MILTERITTINISFSTLYVTHLIASPSSSSLNTRCPRSIDKAGMIPRTTQIVQNDILMEEIMSAHDHLRCKCNTLSLKKRKTRHLDAHPSSSTLVNM